MYIYMINIPCQWQSGRIDSIWFRHACTCQTHLFPYWNKLGIPASDLLVMFCIMMDGFHQPNMTWCRECRLHASGQSACFCNPLACNAAGAHAGWAVRCHGSWSSSVLECMLGRCSHAVYVWLLFQNLLPFQTFFRYWTATGWMRSFAPSLSDLKGVIELQSCTSGDLAQTCWDNPEPSRGWTYEGRCAAAADLLD